MILKANHVWEEYDNTTPTQPTTAPVGKVLIGDTDLNGRVSIKDATLIQMHLASMQTLSGDALTAADVNKDKSVNVRDITAIQRYLAGFSESGSYCGQYTDGTQPVTQPTQPITQPTQPITQPTTPVTGGVTLNPGRFGTPGHGAAAKADGSRAAQAAPTTPSATLIPASSSSE